MAIPVRSEYQEQCDLIAVLNVAGIYYTAVPMGGNRAAITGAMLRRSGARKGWPDVQITTPAPRHPNARGVAIELKAAHLRGLAAGKPSAEQAECLDQLRADGWLVRVCYGSLDAIRWLRDLGYRL
jgi:hypothetical protein